MSEAPVLVAHHGIERRDDGKLWLKLDAQSPVGDQPCFVAEAEIAAAFEQSLGEEIFWIHNGVVCDSGMNYASGGAWSEYTERSGQMAN